MLYGLHLTDDDGIITVEKMNFEGKDELQQAHDHYQVYDDGADHSLVIANTLQGQLEVMKLDEFERPTMIHYHLDSGYFMTSKECLETLPF